MRAVRWLIAVATLAVVFHARATDHSWVTLRGNALTQAFANRDFGDGVHFAYQFLVNGELRGMNMGKPAQGHWRVTGNQLCWRWAKSKDPEECYEVRQQSQAVHLFLDGQEMLSGNLTPPPPNSMEQLR